MPITFDCPCGKPLRVADEHANRRVKCPACGVIGVVPSPEPKFEVVEDAPPPPVRAKPVRATAVASDDDDEPSGYTLARTGRRRRDDDDDAPRKKAAPNFREGSGRDDDDDDDDPRPRKKRKKRRPPPPREDHSGRSLEGRIVNGGVMGGLAAMVIAVVWCLIGLSFDRFFIYTPILFICGLIAFIKGLVGQND